MVVYADVLMVLNLIVDYFLILFSSKLLRVSLKTWRLLLASAAGALSSLYIFLPQSFWVIELAVRLFICALMTFIAFGFGSIKRFFRSMAVLFGVTFGYAGGMAALWYILKPNGMVINNSVVYFDISPVVLILSSVVAYVVIVLLRRLLERQSPDAKVCEVTLRADPKEYTVKAIIDTGNSIEDIMGGGEVIIADRSVAIKLFGSSTQTPELATRYRLVACSTVSGGGMLEGFRCDSAIITHGDKSVELKSPVLAISKTVLDRECPAIINPRVFD